MDKKFYKHEDQQNLHFFNDRQQYSAAIDNSAFCIGPPGVVGWTGRVWEAIYAGTAAHRPFFDWRVKQSRFSWG